MDYKVPLSLAFILIVIACGWIVLTRNNNSLPAEDEEHGPFPDNPPMDRSGNRTNIFEELNNEIQELVNASAGPEEVLELIVNNVEQMILRFNQSEGIPEERVSPIIDFFEELKTKIQGMIDQGTTAQEIQELVSDKIKELMEERSKMTPPG